MSPDFDFEFAPTIPDLRVPEHEVTYEPNKRIYPECDFRVRPVPETEGWSEP